MASIQATARKVFLSSLDVVLPDMLVKKALHRCGDMLTVNGRSYHLNRNVYVVGFGKAVYGKYFVFSFIEPTVYDLVSYCY